MQGIIVKALSGFYYVENGDNVIECRARGALKNKGISPLVGDMVEFSASSKQEGYAVEKILPRKNSLVRPPVANIDKAFIVSSYTTPAPNYLIIDTLIAICEYKNILPVLVFNKSDLGDFTDWCECYTDAGYKVIVTSAEEASGIEELANEFQNCVSVLTGNSGVGKSSLLNLLIPELNLKTGEISEKLGRGRHTTRHTQLYKLPHGGYVADTPGFSSLEIDKTDYDFKENLAYCFKEFEQYLPNCKFTGCSHTGEKGCAVCDAVNNGKIAKSRFDSYILLYNELKDLKKWQIDKK